MNGTTERITLHSDILDHTFELYVYLPAHYNPLYTYHLALTQDGRDYFRLGKIAEHIETAMDEGARQTIVVGVPYPSVRQRREWYHPKSEKSEDYLTFIVKELLPFLDKTYQTWNLSHGRTLLGDSLAGTVSLRAALRYPNTFSRVVMHSPYSDDNIAAEVDNAENTGHFDIYHTIGLEEHTVKTTNGTYEDFLEPNRKLAEALEKKGARYCYKELEGGHFWKVWEADMLPALRFMYDITPPS